MAFFFASVALDMTQVLDFVLILLSYLGIIDHSSYGTSSITSPFVFFGGVVRLSLVIVLVVSISELSIGVIFVFLDQ